MKKGSVAIIIFLCLFELSYGDNLLSLSFYNRLEDSISKQLTDTGTLKKIDTKFEQQKYDLKAATLNIEVSPLNTEIKGNIVYEAKVLKDQFLYFVIELHPQIKIDNFKVNGKLISYDRVNKDVIAYVPFLKKGDVFNVEIDYFRSSEVPYGVGLNKKDILNYGIYHDLGYDNIPVTFSCSEPFFASDWFPCKQDLKDRIDHLQINITCDKKYTACSVGILKEVRDLDNGKHCFVWVNNEPITYFSIAFAVADYYRYSYFFSYLGSEQGTFSIQNYVYNRKENIKHIKHRFFHVLDIMDYLDDIFGLYPYRKQKYGHVQVPFYACMEHQTLSFMGCVDVETIAHELTHQWFGNNVTACSWNHVWLHQGFSTYAQYLILEKLGKEKDASEWLYSRSKQARDEEGKSIYISDQEIAEGGAHRIFDYATTYCKGALILHMLRNEINNDDLFFACLKKYQHKFKGGCAAAEDFFEVVKEVCKKDYSWFLQQWYYGSSFPLYSISWDYQSENKRLIIYSKQEEKQSNTEVFKMTNLIDVKYTDGSVERVRYFQEKAFEKIELRVKKDIESIVFNPGKENLLELLNIENVGIDENKDNYSVNIYPNPANSYITIEQPKAYRGGVLNIYNLEGLLIQCIKLDNEKNKIDISTHTPGIYMLRINNEKKVCSRRIVIQ
ncbi:MAG: M1 family aminopeptidase [Bacteroidales bacterium]